MLILQEFRLLTSKKYFTFAILMSQAELYSYRPLLYSIAYKLVGCATTAEDLVQDTFVNWLKFDTEKVKDAKAYLVRSVTNISFNYLSSLRKKKEELMDNFSSSLSGIGFTPDFSSMDIKCEVTQAVGQMMKRLAPAERAVFVLRELFDFDYSEVTTILGKTSDNCRKIFSRAQQNLLEGKDRFSVDSDTLKQTVLDFKKATLGEYSELIDKLKKDMA